MFFRRFLVAGLLLVFTATAASAYTVVMRNGRRVEIPNTFTLTKSTLTYETAPGIQITIQLASVDIAATERVNGQAAGSLLATPAQPKTPPAPVQTPRTTAVRSITNKDLEVYRRARLEGERERHELGLPSAEQRQREVEEIDNRTLEQIREKRSQEELDFWRNRATQLEAQMSAAGGPLMRNQYIAEPYGIVSGGFVSEFDGFHRFNRFNRSGFKNAFGFNNRFGFNPGFNILNPAFRGQFKRPLRFTIPKSGGGHRGGSRGGRR